jgi:UDP-4-amino-4,6-dideoxy-N-acetyl-beta-L-altrosamine N-acetyltransferase
MSVKLRKVAPSDSARLLAWRNAPEVSAYMYTDHNISQVEHDRWFAAINAPDRRYWVITLDDQPVGLANLARIDRLSKRCEWAYYLGESSTRGRGVGSSVEYIVLRHVFETLKLNKLWCEVLASNEAVWKLHESFGFTREALFREHAFKAGKFEDVVGLGILASDWARVKPGIEDRLASRGGDPAAIPDAE